MHSLRKVGSIAAMGVLLAGTTLATSTPSLKDVRKGIIEHPSMWKIVVGEKAAAADVIGAIEIASALQYWSKKPVSIDLSDIKIVAKKTVQKVEDIKLYRDSVPIYLGDTLSKSLSRVLVHEGVVKGNEKEYSYKVYIETTNSKIVFENKPDTDEFDPSVLVHAPLFKIKVQFDAGSYLNLTDAKGEEIEILGKTFYIDTDSTGNIVLRPFAKKVMLEVSEEKQGSIEFEGHAIVLKGIVESSPNEYGVMISVDGQDEILKEGESKVFGDIRIYVKDVFLSTINNKGWAVLLIGKETDSLVLRDGEGVEYNDKLYRTVVPHIEKDASGNIKSITFEVHVSEDSDKDYVEVGKEFVPFIFDNIKFIIEKGNVTTDKIAIVPEGNDKYVIKVGGEEIPVLYLEDGQYIDFLKYVDDNANSTVFKGQITGTSTSVTTPFKVKEREVFGIYDPAGKETYLYYVKDIAVYDNYVNVYLQGLYGKDITLEKISKSSTEPTEVTIGPFTFKVYYNSTNEELVFTNVDSTNNVEKVITLYTDRETRIVLNDNDTDLTNGVNLPFVVEIYHKYPELVSTEAKVFNVSIGIDGTDNKYLDVQTYRLYNTDGSSATVLCGDDSVKGLNNVGVSLDISINRDGADTVKVEVPVSSVTYKPSVLLKEEEQVLKETIKPGGEFEGWKIEVEVPENVTAEKVVPLPIGAIGMLDSEVPSPWYNTEYNLIVVGGPCVNRVAAELLNKTFPTCGPESGLTPNTALIKVVEEGGKFAVLIAGWEWMDTRRAAIKFAKYIVTGEGLEEDKAELFT